MVQQQSVTRGIKTFVLLGFGLVILLAYLSLGAVSLPLSDIINTLMDALLHGEDYAREQHPRVVAI